MICPSLLFPHPHQFSKWQSFLILCLQTLRVMFSYDWLLPVFINMHPRLCSEANELKSAHDQKAFNRIPWRIPEFHGVLTFKLCPINLCRRAPWKLMWTCSVFYLKLALSSGETGIPQTDKGILSSAKVANTEVDDLWYYRHCVFIL